MERAEKKLLSEDKEEDELDKVKKNKKEEEEGDNSCLWSLTTDAGISRHTTIFTLGIPVRSNIFTQTIEK